VGHIACFDDKAIHRELPDKVILTLFAERAAVEIERRRLSLAQPLLATNGESLASPASPRGDLPG
jgi:hypothetical protein